MTHIVDGQDCLVWRELVALELVLHWRLNEFFLELLRVRKAEPAFFLGHLLGTWASGREHHLRDLVELVLMSDEHHGAARDMVLSLGQRQALDAIWEDVGLLEHDRIALFLEARVFLGSDPFVTLEVVGDELPSIGFLLLLVELDHCELLLADASGWIGPHEAKDEELL